MRTIQLNANGYSLTVRIYATRASMRRAAVRSFGSFFRDAVALFVPGRREVWFHRAGLDHGTVAHEFFHAAQHAAKDEEKAAEIMDLLTTEWRKKCKKLSR